MISVIGWVWSRHFVVGIVFGALFCLTACSPNPSSRHFESNRAEPIRPPLAEQRNHLVQAPAGVRVDPYYWLRDDRRANPEVLAYLQAENDYERARLAHLDELRSRLVTELRSRIVDQDQTAPVLIDGYWYYSRYPAGREYPIHARKKGHLDGPEEIVLDVNELAGEQAFYALGQHEVSLDGRYVAFLEDTVGRRQHHLRIKDLSDGRIRDPGISGVSSISWSADNRHLFYVANEPETLRSWQVMRLDALAGERGELVYQEDDPAFYTTVTRTTSNAWNLIILSSTKATEVRFVASDQPAQPFAVFLARRRDHEYQIDHLDDRWLIRSNWQAPNFRILSAALSDHGRPQAWREVLAHSSERFIHGFRAHRDFLAISERFDGLRRIRLLDWSSGDSRLLEFGEPAYAVYLGDNPDQSRSVLRFVYTSLTTPNQIWEIDVHTGQRRLIKQDPVGGPFKPSDYRIRRLWAPARDGQVIPVSLVHHRNTSLDGSAPLIQHGYGAYGYSNEPVFRRERLSLLNRGFVLAIAHVRGGQELGVDWYEGGRLLNKNNTFHDFIDVTNYLVEASLVDPNRVFARGGSAGGLLMAAIANMAPERYTGIVAHAPFVDVVTTMLDETIPLTTNEFDEWGNPADPEFYAYMLSYSPYDNVRVQSYPAMMVTTGLWDSQVQYWEPVKWVARLRATKTNATPLVLHINMAAGHGGASGRFQRLDQWANEYAFVLDLAGMAENL